MALVSWQLCMQSVILKKWIVVFKAIVNKDLEFSEIYALAVLVTHPSSTTSQLLLSFFYL